MDTAVGSLIAILIAAAALWFGIRWLVRSFSRYGGSKIITCPETKEPAIVEVDSLHAWLTGTIGFPDIGLENCSRWPMKEECGQECLIELDVAPENCLVSGVLMRWYRDKNCVYCGKSFPEIHWIDNRPGLQSPDGKLLDWNEVGVEKLEDVLKTHLPVCSDCYIAQMFRHDHPELVVYRPWRNDSSGDANGSSASRQF